MSWHPTNSSVQLTSRLSFDASPTICICLKREYLRWGSVPQTSATPVQSVDNKPHLYV